MKLHSAMTRIIVAALSLYVIAKGIFGPIDPSAAPPAASRKKTVLKTVIATALSGMLLLVLGGFLFMMSGIYNIAASEPHIKPVRWALRTGRTRSVQFHSRGIKAPQLRPAVIATAGLRLYRTNCEPCHGAPGIAREQLGRGINPNPPPLVMAVHNWTDAQLYWIFTNGLKMSGMPAFGVRFSESDRWALVTFLRRLPLLSPAEYSRLAATAKGPDYAAITWSLDDQGFSAIRRGDAEVGRELVRRYGCVACHAIPGMSEARVGPPLRNFAERQYIAGSLVNVPANAVAWIVNPQRIEPGTAMPNLNVQPDEALHITAYLYTFGSPKRLDALRQTAVSD